MPAAPGGRLAEVAQPAGRVRRRVGPEQERPPGVGRVAPDRGPAPIPRASAGGTATGRQPAKQRTHGVGRIGHGRVQHDVAVGVAQVQVLADRRDELLGADARADRLGLDADAEAPLDPPAGGVSQHRGCRPTRGSRARCPTRPSPRARRGPAGRTACRPSSRPSRPRGPGPASPRRAAGGTGTAAARSPWPGSRRRHELGEPRPAGLVEQDGERGRRPRRPPARPPRPRDAPPPARRHGHRG